MANRDFKPVKALEREVVIIGGRISFTNGTATVSEGSGYTCSNMSSGVFTITLSDKYSDLLYTDAHVVGTGGPERYIECTAHDVSSAKTLSFVCNDHSDDDVTGDSDSDQEIQFIAFLKNSSLT
jgi:hypothetical protein|tara:strand:- start:234 stop:605 length:372 start_codon:yes stop_codon:yes gene_type:complete